MRGHRRIAGTTDWHTGNFAAARTHLEQALALHDRERDADPGYRFGPDFDAASSIMLAASLWQLGEAVPARHFMEASLARAKETGHVLSLVWVLSYAIILELMCGDADRAMPLSETRGELCSAHGLTV